MKFLNGLRQKGKFLTSKIRKLIGTGKHDTKRKKVNIPGTWMTESESVIYGIMPKCGCSTIGQILYYSDNGFYYDGDVHDATSGIHKWQFEASKPIIKSRVLERGTYTFTCVRNPYARILSSFFDKICGIQRNGKRYSEKIMPILVNKYGVEMGGIDGRDEFDQIDSFRGFVEFAHDTIVRRQPMAPDIHWATMTDRVERFVANGGRYNNIFWLEKFNEGMQSVLDSIKVKHPIDLVKVPRFNESEGHGPKRIHSVEDYFDDKTMHLIYEMYHLDFELFKYDFSNPSNLMPVGEIDLYELHDRLGK